MSLVKFHNTCTPSTNNQFTNQFATETSSQPVEDREWAAQGMESEYSLDPIVSIIALVRGITFRDQLSCMHFAHMRFS